MNDGILDAIQLYLVGYIDIDSLEDRVIPLAWDDSYGNRELLDQVAVEFVYFKDGLSDESDFRERIAEIANQAAMAD